MLGAIALLAIRFYIGHEGAGRWWGVEPEGNLDVPDAPAVVRSVRAVIDADPRLAMTVIPMEEDDWLRGETFLLTGSTRCLGEATNLSRT